METRSVLSMRWLAAAMVAASLSACGGANDDLRAYIDEVKARPGGRIEPLPPVEPAPTFTYEPGPRRSPFTPDAPQRRVSNDPNAVDGPDRQSAARVSRAVPARHAAHGRHARRSPRELRLDSDDGRARAPRRRRQSHGPELRPHRRHLGFRDSIGGDHLRRSRRVPGTTCRDWVGRLKRRGA